MNLTYFQDPSHGWIKAPRSLIDSLGIAAKVSSYSYQNASGAFCYLEEDADASLLLEAAKAKGQPLTIVSKQTQRASFIRKLPAFRA